MKLSILAIIAVIAPLCSGATIFEDTIAKNYPIDRNATIAIHNRDGAIWIYGADTSEVKMQAIKKAYSEERLAKIDIDVSVSPQRLTITTNYPTSPQWSWRDRSGTVDYVLVVPLTCKIEQAELANGEVLIEGMRENTHATLSNGRMFVHNCFGNIAAEVANGGLDVSFDWWEPSVPFRIDANITNGNSRAVIPEDAAFHLVAASENGHVFSDFADRQERERNGSPKIDIVVSGPSSAELALRAVNGSIRVVEMKY